MTVLVEAARGSREKHAYNERTLEYRGKSETLLPYPYPYGFILGTRTPEGDCVDCYLLTTRSLSPGEQIEAEPVGLLEFFEGDELDHKVLAALPGEMPTVDAALRDELETFMYGIFRKFPEMRVRVGDLLPSSAALDFISRRVPSERER